MKTILTLLILSQTLAWSADPVAVFKAKLPAAVGPLSTQAFCYEDARGELKGHRTQAQQMIASVTKLFTTLFILDSQLPSTTYTTTFTLQGKRLHISGGNDPWFDVEKVIALANGLRNLGVASLDEITFDDKLIINIDEPGAYSRQTAAHTQASLTAVFSPSGKLTQAALNSKARLHFPVSEEKAPVVLGSSGLATKSIRFVTESPLSSENVQVFQHTSRPLSVIIKAMNVYSINKIAQNLWDLGKKFRDPKEVFTRLGIPAGSYVLHNGSGLATLGSGGRLDNTASCVAIMKLLAALENMAAFRKIELEEIVAVGNDRGSYKERFLNDGNVKKGVLAKTGTHRYASALAGWIESDQPYRFAILNRIQEQQNAPAREFQDKVLSGWMQGRATNRNFAPINLFAWEGNFLK